MLQKENTVFLIFFLLLKKLKGKQEVQETDLIIVRKNEYTVFDYHENNSTGLWQLWLKSNSLN